MIEDDLPRHCLTAEGQSVIERDPVLHGGNAGLICFHDSSAPKSVSAEIDMAACIHPHLFTTLSLQAWRTAPRIDSDQPRAGEIQSSAREAVLSQPVLQLPLTDTDDVDVVTRWTECLRRSIATGASRLRYHVRRWTARLSRT
jgi:hypothetical protein